MRLEMNIRMDDDAFRMDPYGELKRILYATADAIQEQPEAFRLWQTVHDINGNDVGRVKIIAGLED